MRTRIMWLSAALAVLAAFPGCRTGADETSARSPNTGPALGQPLTADPCTRLDPGALKAITGWDLGPGSRPTGHEQPDQMVCNWESADLHAAVQVQVHLEGRAQFDRRRAAVTGDGLPRPTDLIVPGTDAAYEVPGHGIIGLLVHDRFVQVQTVGLTVDPATHPGALAALAAAVVAGKPGS